VSAAVERVPSADVAVVIPALNPGAALARTVTDVRQHLERSGRTVEIVVVSDGSTDGSEVALSGWVGVRVISHHPRRGKGYALRRGLADTTAASVLFIDADGDIDAAVLPLLCDALDADVGAWAAVADRFHDDSITVEHWTRRVAHLGFARLTSWAFGLDVVDTQCGAKGFRRHSLHALLPKCEQDGFVFDVELLALGAAHEMGSVVAVPVRVERLGDSTLTVTVAARMAAQVAMLWWQLSVPRRRWGTRR
jgi:glycosyltransferase involved in cell wall biosynthesis